MASLCPVWQPRVVPQSPRMTSDARHSFEFVDNVRDSVLAANLVVRAKLQTWQ